MDKELKKIDIDKEEEADKKREKEGKINSINQEKEDANDESIDNESESQNKAKIELDELLNELAAIKRENYDPKKICPEEFSSFVEELVTKFLSKNKIIRRDTISLSSKESKKSNKKKCSC